ncbi:MAG: 1-acyl-sn-glycerol-3-phosphate acyltransferase [Oscillospiraceae bacterium]|jgi:1-acyl-sn-glycerol-3-phosphate acyltransferase|nr:1-acyl-sn-glycerol-3-phosphate acyltransferase [Oscillospiraceae bacterium]
MIEKYSKGFYSWCYKYVGPVINFFRPIEVIGKENLIEGAALVCSNHSAMIDPFLIGIAFGDENHIHVIAKIELFRIPVLSWFLKKMGMISVDRSINDVNSVKNSLTYLKNGEKVVIFPEGTRRMKLDVAAVKSGAVKLAERAKVPILPVFVPRKKPYFKKSKIVIGKPYFIEKLKEKRHPDDYHKLAEELMYNIQSLGTEKL